MTTTGRRSRGLLVPLVLLVGLAWPLRGAPGSSLALEIGVGTQGILSFQEIGLRMPLVRERFFVELKVRLLSSLTWATFVDLRSGESVSFHPDVIGGVLSCGGVSPVFSDLLRMYGGMDLFVGYSFTPWDSAVYGVPNLIGGNVTYAFWGYFGFELLPGPRVSLFLDAGGGFKSIRADRENPYAMASSWLGSGFGLKMGVRFYLGRGNR